MLIWSSRLTSGTALRSYHVSRPDGHPRVGISKAECKQTEHFSGLSMIRVYLRLGRRSAWTNSIRARFTADLPGDSGKSWLVYFHLKSLRDLRFELGVVTVSLILSVPEANCADQWMIFGKSGGEVESYVGHVKTVVSRTPPSIWCLPVLCSSFSKRICCCTRTLGRKKSPAHEHVLQTELPVRVSRVFR